MDVSAAALAIAEMNARDLGLGDRVTFLQSDWFDQVEGRFDLIVSNPPYVTASDYAGLSAEVRNWEPRFALTPGGDGVTHQGTEDMGTMRTIPNMCVIMPADDVATRRAVFAAADWAGPVYLRFTRDGVPAIYDDDDERFSIGKAIQLVDGDDLTLIAVGDMVSKALLAAERLLQNGRAARVLDMHTIKPLDTEAVQRAAEDTGAIVTVEDHNIMNGLGSAVAEYLVENCPIPMQRIGLPDTFGESGPYEELLEKYGMATDHIVDAARKVLSAKRRGRRRG